MRFLGTILVFAIPTGLSFADEQAERQMEERTELANAVARAFQQGVESKQATYFQEVIEKTNRLWELGIATPQLCRIRAQAHTILGEPAQAIRAYREGLQIDPTNERLWQELQQVQSGLGIPASSPVWDQSILGNSLSAFSVQWCALGLAALGWLCLGRWFVKRTPLLFWIGVMGIGIGWVGWGIVKYEQSQFKKIANQSRVIVQEEIRPRLGNSLEYPPVSETRFAVGEELLVLHHRGDWVQCQNREGIIGWIPNRAGLEVRKLRHQD